MAKKRGKRQGLLGVEFHDSEIRVVDVRFSGGRPILLAAGTTPTPPNSIVEGEIVRADAVGFALRKLLDNLGATATEAVFGIPMSGFTTRSLNIPPTPPDEQAMLIEGEVRHFDILRTADGAYDFFELASSDSPETNIILFAAEGPITNSLKVVAERAGLDVVAIEPVSIAQLRTAANSGVSAPDGLFLSIGENASEASIIRGGRLWLYRRIDIGVNALFALGREDAMRVDHTLTKEEEEEASKHRARELRRGPADSLGIEVRRTMEYYAREITGANPVTVLHLLLNDTVLAPIEPFLRDSTGAEIQVVRPSGFISQSDASAQEVASEIGYRYAGAYGLALHGHDEGHIVPELDLFVRERSMAAMEFKRRTLVGSLVASIAAIALGIAGTYYFGTQANDAQAQADEVKRQTAQLRALQEATMKADQETMEQISFLSTQGIPTVWLLDSLATTLDPGVGFNRINLENEASVLLEGEAKNVQSLVLTVQRIQSQPGLGLALVNSYERIDKETNDPAVRFQVRVLRTMPAPAPTPPVAQPQAGQPPQGKPPAGQQPPAGQTKTGGQAQ